MVVRTPRQWHYAPRSRLQVEWRWLANTTTSVVHDARGIPSVETEAVAEIDVHCEARYASRQR